MPSLMLTYQEALYLIEKTVKPLPVFDISWRDAFGCTLADDVRAVENTPLYDNSAMDGFAVHAKDTEHASDASPITLEVVKSIFADMSFPQHIISPGKAAKIMTGAPVPKGANAVVVVEKTKVRKASVDIFQRVNPGQNIRNEAEEIKKGSVILSAGTRIGSAELGLLASQGITDLSIRQNPAVSIMPTGNELVEPEEKTQDAQIRNVNGYTLISELDHLGCKTASMGIGRDEPDILKAKIENGLKQADVLLTSGGVSMGDKDFLPSILQDLGMKVHFHKVSVKPGKPLLFGELHGKYIFGLPGNVVSTMASFHLFVKPALRLLSGRNDWKNPVWYVRSGVACNNHGNRSNFIRCYITHSPTGLPIAFPTGKQGSGMLSSLVGADGFAVIPSDIDTVKEHDVLEFIPTKTL